MGKSRKKEPPAVAAADLAPPDKPISNRERATSGRGKEPPAAVGAPPRKRSLAAFLPEGGLLPWWVVLLLGSYALLKMGMTLEHPCGVLGMSGSSVTRSSVSKAYRQFSMCSHPDKLRMRTAADMKRGELLFKRASAAREELFGLMRVPASAVAAAAAAGEEVDPSSAEASCSTQLDAALYSSLRFMFEYLHELGLRQIGGYLAQSLMEVLTLEHGATWSASILLLLLTLGSFIWGLLRHLLTTGPITALLSILAAAVVGPLPTLALLVALPFLRVADFVRQDLYPALGLAPKIATAPTTASAEPGAAGADESTADANGVSESDEEEVEEEAEEEAEVAEGAAGTGAATRRRLNAKTTADEPRKGARQRGRPLSKGALTAEREALLHGEDGGASAAQDPRLSSANPFTRAAGAVARRPRPSG